MPDCSTCCAVSAFTDVDQRVSSLVQGLDLKRRPSIEEIILLLSYLHFDADIRYMKYPSSGKMKNSSKMHCTTTSKSKYYLVN